MLLCSVKKTTDKAAKATQEAAANLADNVKSTGRAVADSVRGGE